MRYLLTILVLAACGAPIEFPDDVPAFKRGAVMVVSHPDFEAGELVFECGPEAVALRPDSQDKVIISDCGAVVSDANGTWGAPPFSMGREGAAAVAQEATDDLEVGWVRYQQGDLSALVAWDVR